MPIKAIIPVAGVGTRLRPHTYTQPKPLIPVAGKPIIAFTIEQLIEQGIDDFVFVIGYLGEKIRFFVESRYPNIRKTFVEQHQREGLGHAIWMARDAIRDANEVFIVLGDTIFDVDYELYLANEHSCVGIKKVDDPRLFGVAEITDDGIVTRLVEKPRIPKTNLALVGLYKIKEVDILLSALDHLVKNDEKTLGEYQLTDALMRMVEMGIHFDTLPVNNWYDCGKKDVLLETNATLLKSSSYASEDLPPYDNSIINHPVSIGKNCKISNSIIGPNVTIGDNASIHLSIVNDSIIGNFASIEEIVLQHAVIGNDTSITGIRHSLSIGDNTEIDFSWQA
jgi:glucose-1-phosphate thymidylyltransferase